MYLVKKQQIFDPRENYVNLRGGRPTGIRRWDALDAARTAYQFFRDNDLPVVRVFDAPKRQSFICESMGLDTVKVRETGQTYYF